MFHKIILTLKEEKIKDGVNDITSVEDKILQLETAFPENLLKASQNKNKFSLQIVPSVNNSSKAHACFWGRSS